MAKVVEREAPFQIGFREFYRIVIPGIILLLLLISIIPEISQLDLFLKIALCFFLGLISYSMQISRSKIKICGRNFNFYSRFFSEQIDHLIHDMNNVCDIPQGANYNARAAYKYFLEKYMGTNIRERIHYFTSFHYMFMDASFIFLLYWIFNVSLLVISFLFPSIVPTNLLVYNFKITLSRDLLYFKILLSLILSILFGCYGHKVLCGIIDEERVLIREEFKNHCHLIVSATWKEEKNEMSTSLEIMKNLVIKKTEETLKKIILDPEVEIKLFGCDILDKVNWRSGNSIKVFCVKIKTSNRLMVMGEPGNYKGMYKENIEALLNSFVSQVNQNYQVHVEVYGSEGPLHRLIPLERAVQSGIITKLSPVYKAADKFGIPYVLIRGRFIEGPNPGLAEITEKLMKKGDYKNVLDLFSGTGIVSKVALLNHAEKVVCIDQLTGDQLSIMLKDYKNKVEAIKCDAFSFEIKEPFDLIVADPDYENAIKVIQEIAPKIKNRCKAFVLCHGSVEDERWNKEARELLQTLGYRIEPIELLGQAITICLTS